MAAPCLPPLPPGRGPRFAVPEGACDSHTHVFGPYARFPLAAERSYTMPETPVEAHLAHLDALGFARGVVVTASVQGTDNANLLDALRRHPDRLRGVAVLGADATDSEIDALHAAGTRGARLNLARNMRGGVGLDVLPRLAPRLRERGWHLQVWCFAPELPAALPALEATGMDLVIDHMAKPRPADGIAEPGFRLLVDLVRDGRAWVKISGVDRITEDLAPWSGADPFARALLAANPARCVWGSDWPHVSYYPPRPMSEDAALADRLAEWAPDAALRRRVLVDNPALLYGF